MENTHKFTDMNPLSSFASNDAGLALSEQFDESMRFKLPSKFLRGVGKVAGSVIIGITSFAGPANAENSSPTDSAAVKATQEATLFDQLVAQGFPSDLLLPKDQLEQLYAQYRQTTEGNILHRDSLFAVGRLCLPPTTVRGYQYSSITQPTVFALSPFRVPVLTSTVAQFENGKITPVPADKMTLVPTNSKGFSSTTIIDPSTLLYLELMPTFIEAGYTDANQTPSGKITTTFSDLKTGKLIVKEDVVIPELRYDRTNPNPDGRCGIPTSENISSSFTPEKIDSATINAWNSINKKIQKGSLIGQIDTYNEFKVAVNSSKKVVSNKAVAQVKRKIKR